ncbi:hypothetical protein AX16_005442 [Volvariella volvacea WC 439]|nr:hypothetical protein AX16_005442 [Volvariella volvacea WC 439]
MSTPTEQQALYLETPLSGKFEVKSAPIYKPGPGDLLVRIKAAALNPIDWKIHRHNFFIKSYPAILGTDAAGEIVEVGEGVTRFKPGDRVLYQGYFELKDGCFQQYNLADHAVTGKIPANISYDEASSIPVAFNAAYLCLYDKLGFEPPTKKSALGKYKGTPILIIGGATSVGQYAIQMAKASGFSPILTIASPKHTDYLKSLGATHVLDRNLSFSSLGQEIAKVTSPLFKYIVDTVSSPETQKMGMDLLAEGGHMAIVLAPEVEKVPGKTVSNAVAVRTYPQHRALLEDMYLHLEEWLESGLLKPNKVEVIGGLEAIPAGLLRLENNQVSCVKLICRP